MTADVPTAPTSRPQRRTDRDGGFTLVEVLIVIVVLGVLSVVTVFAFRGIVDRGEQSTCESDARTLVAAGEAYLAQHSASAIPPSGDPSDLDAHEQTLVDAGLLREVSKLHQLDSDAKIASSVTSCASSVPTT